MSDVTRKSEVGEIGQASGATEKKVERDGWRSTFHDHFVRKLEVIEGGTVRRTLFDQATDGSTPVRLPGAAPDPNSRIVIEGGPSGRRVTLQVHDPRRHIAEIHVLFKTAQEIADEEEAWRAWNGGPGGVGAHQAAGPAQPGGRETVVISDNVVMCPPRCPTAPAEPA